MPIFIGGPSGRTAANSPPAEPQETRLQHTEEIIVHELLLKGFYMVLPVFFSIYMIYTCLLLDLMGITQTHFENPQLVSTNQ